MSFWKRLFGQDKPVEEQKPAVQLPGSMVAQEFGEVNVRRRGAVLEILVTISMEPTGADAEGWQTGVAIDASGSMMGAFGKGLIDGPRGEPPTSLLQQYHRKGWLSFVERGGDQFPILTDEAKQDLVERGHFRWTQNEVEPFARKMIAYLASNLDADGGTTVIYWACGSGSQIEEIGDLKAEEVERTQFRGPRVEGFGSSTILTPAVRYFADKFRDAKNGMYIFITDGAIADLKETKRYTIQLCKDIKAGRRNAIKCVLIGVGDEIDEGQMEELDDLDSGTDVDIWDHKIARDMRALVDIFAEVVKDNQIVAPTARIFDASGQVVKNFADGLPAKITFTMPASSEWFELEVAGQRIRQSVVVNG